MTPINAERFLDTVCAQIRWRRWREPIRNELRAHLEDRIEYLIVQRGFLQEEAEAEALSAMGDPVEIGRALDREHRPWQFYGYICFTSAIIVTFLYLIYQFLH